MCHTNSQRVVKTNEKYQLGSQWKTGLLIDTIILN